MITKRLYRSRTDRIFAGVFGGLGEYFNLDPVLLRVIWIVLFVVTGFIPGIIIYLLVLFIMPSEAPRVGSRVYDMPGSRSTNSTSSAATSSSQPHTQQTQTDSEGNDKW